jgi:histidinol dehydrogenase
MAMRILKKKKEIQAFLRILRERACGPSAEIEEQVKKILSDVRSDGDTAVIAYTKQFDSLNTSSLRITPSEIKRHAGGATRKIVRSIEGAAKRIRRFHEMQMEHSWYVVEPGYKRCQLDRLTDVARILDKGRSYALLGQIVRSLQRVGVYVPGGKASYPSSVLMNVIPAQVAGVEEIALCVPTPRDEINPFVMSAIDMLGITEVYRIGGAQAVGAMAYGTKTIRRVDKIVGPGNIYVATAKKMVFGEVDIDMIAGPSEILIIADSTAEPDFIASDLLSQAEHDELASSIMVTDSPALAEAVAREIASQLSRLVRRDITEQALGNYGAIIITKDMRESVMIANDIAPEHLEIISARPQEILPLIRNAGAIFLGRWTPEPIGDYAAGPNHTLPTGGTARFFSPLGVYDFFKRSSLLSFSREGFSKLAKTVTDFSEIEGLSAHGNTVRVRCRKGGRN